MSAALQRFRRIEKMTKEQRELTDQQLAMLEAQRLAALQNRTSQSNGAPPSPVCPARHVCRRTPSYIENNLVLRHHLHGLCILVGHAAGHAHAGCAPGVQLMFVSQHADGACTAAEHCGVGQSDYRGQKCAVSARTAPGEGARGGVRVVIVSTAAVRNAGV